MTLEPTPAQTKPKRRRFTISLRAMMVLVLIVGGGIGWKASRASKQRRALVALKAINAHINYDYQFPGGKYDPKGKPWAPEWLRKRVGEEYFQEIIGISFVMCNRKVTDADMACLDGLDYLENLDVVRGRSFREEPEGQELTDAGLVFLDRLARLKKLGLHNTRITDAGLAKLAQNSTLEELDLDRTRITVAGLAALKTMKSLRKLELNGSCSTDEGLAQVVQLKQLQGLKIQEHALPRNPGIEAPSESPFDLNFDRSIPLKDASWDLLGQLPNLRELELYHVPISDGNLAQLRKLPGLRELKITLASHFDNRTQITDAGLAQIAAMTELETLWLSNHGIYPAQGITAAGVSRLASLNKLRELSLQGMEYTDDGLSFVGSLTELRSLDLDCKNMTDLTLFFLKGLTKLEKLRIIHGKITDSGTVHLRKLINLTELFLWWTHVSNQGFLNLRAALPSLTSADNMGSAPPVVPQSESDDDKKPDEGKPQLPATPMTSPFNL